MSVAVGLMSQTLCISFLFGIFCVAQLFESSEAAVKFGVCGPSEYGRNTTTRLYKIFLSAQPSRQPVAARAKRQKKSKGFQSTRQRGYLLRVLVLAGIAGTNAREEELVTLGRRVPGII